MILISPSAQHCVQVSSFEYKCDIVIRGSHHIHKEITGVSHGQAEGLSGSGKVAMLSSWWRRGELLWVFVAKETRDEGWVSLGAVVTGGLLHQLFVRRSAHFLFGRLWFAPSCVLLIVTAVWSAATTSCQHKSQKACFFLYSSNWPHGGTMSNLSEHVKRMSGWERFSLESWRVKEM